MIFSPIQHKSDMEIKKRIIVILLILFGLFALGVAGYRIIEKWDYLDAFFMTVITLATVGYGEVKPLTEAGRIFTIFLIIGGIGLFSYSIATIGAIVAEGEIVKNFRRRKMEKKIRSLKEHYIVCGCRDIGRNIIDELIKTKKSFVAIDTDEAYLARIDDKVEFFLLGDPAEDITLEKAGIENASGIFCALSNDKDNLFIVLAARNLNKKIRIVTECVEDSSIGKFHKAGADNVISTNVIGGMRMASEMLRPNVTDFLDIMLRGRSNVRVNEVLVEKDSSFNGVTVSDFSKNHKAYATTVALKRASGDYLYHFSEDLQIEEGDSLIVIADPEVLKKIK